MKHAGRVIRFVPNQILVPALPRERFSQSMSLYTALRVGPAIPLGVATSLS